MSIAVVQRRLIGVIMMVATAACLPAACGDSPNPDRVVLQATAEWNQVPRTLADIGYHISAVVAWTDRKGTCAHIPPALHLTINDVEATRGGSTSACAFDALFESGPFPVTDVVTIRALDGDSLIGEATFEGTFWGAQARVLSPDNPEEGVMQDDHVLVSIPSGKEARTPPLSRWYWLEGAPSQPPPFTLSIPALGDEPATVDMTVPSTAGKVGPQVVVLDYPLTEVLQAKPCTKFFLCNLDAHYTLGPLSLTIVLPP